MAEKIRTVDPQTCPEKKERNKVENYEKIVMWLSRGETSNCNENDTK